jgi:hypothetical protein
MKLSVDSLRPAETCMEWRPAPQSLGRPREASVNVALFMNFRLVWMGPDDDPQARNHAVQRGVTAPSSGELTRYARRGSEMVRQERSQNGRIKVSPVANFHARIACDILIEDGERQKREFGIEAELGGMKLAFSVPATEFSRMGWVPSKLGPLAIIYPGQQQHARAAIQWLSSQIRQERIFAHLGWRKIGAHWVYLHAAGALGIDGAASGIRVQLPAALDEYRIGPPQDPQGRAEAVCASLRFLDVAPPWISFPLLAGIYRAALGGAAFSLFLAGTSGVFKSALAALCQQHFGAAMDATRLPASFASTANSVAAMAFHAKDALLVVDDFAPTGLQGDRELHSVAERLFRSAGNQQGRSRLSNGADLCTLQAPRALVLATGEDIPKGQSIRARLLIIEVAPGDVNCADLTECQNAARQGQYAASMGAFLVWTANQHDRVQRQFREQAQEIRKQGRGRAIHARLPAASALRCF